MSTLTRVLKNQAATLSHTFYVDETATDSSVAVTYAVADANGTSVTSGTATHGATGVYSFTLAAQSALKRGTVTWSATVGAATSEVDYFEIVGGFFFTLAAGRASDSSLSNTTTYPLADLVTKRLEVETECETICDRSFVPRYDRVVLDGSGSAELLLKPSDPNRSVADIRTIRRIAVAPDVDETFVDFTAAQLAGVAPLPDGTLRRTDGSVFTEGWRNVIVEWEYGLDVPYSELVTASLTRFRSRLNLNKSGIPDRASSFTVSDGGVFRLDMPGAFKTGLPEVDAVYARYSRRSTGSGPTARGVPASRPLNYDPQRWSLYHGGVR